MKKAADRSGCGLRLLVCWDCGFESRRGHGSLSLVYVVCCQVEAFRFGPIARSEECYRVCCFLGCDLEASVMRRPWPVRSSCAMDEEGETTVALCSVPYTATSCSIAE
jgi:hypothetical protein